MTAKRMLSIGAAVIVGAGLAACSGGVTGSSPELTIKGSSGAAPALAVARELRVSHSVAAGPGETPVGDPASMAIGMYALYISPNADCSQPVLVGDNGATPVEKDFALTPVLFTATPTAGTYQCLVLRMSDVIQFTSDVTSGHCAIDTPYRQDIYREGENDWRDIDGTIIPSTGTDAAPLDDKVYIFIARDTAAVVARGYSPNQVIQLHSDLVVPSTATFYWNGTNSITSWDDSQGGTGCGLNPGQPEFR